MALRKTLTRLLFSTSHLRAAAASSCPCTRLSAEEPPLLLRLLHTRPLFQDAVLPDRTATVPLIDRIRRLGADRIRLDGILPPAAPEVAPAGMTVEEVRKVIRATQLEAARARLRDVVESCVTYEELVRICSEVSSERQGPGIARSLDQAGAVIVLGDYVLLRPDQVAKAIRSMIPLPTNLRPQNNERSSELREMEEKKAVIDKKANALVRKEMWGGLGFIALQMVGFMRLTFWELSWDVMEPICFFATSTYFMAGYAFFMRTAKEPSFEGFFEARFAAKQQLLMKEHKFDPLRFDELRRTCSSHPLEELLPLIIVASVIGDYIGGNEIFAREIVARVYEVIEEYR